MTGFQIQVSIPFAGPSGSCAKELMQRTSRQLREQLHCAVLGMSGGGEMTFGRQVPPKPLSHSSTFFPRLGVCRVVSLTCFSLLSLTAAAQSIFSFLQEVITEVPLEWLIGSALGSGWPILEPAETVSLGHGVSS